MSNNLEALQLILKQLEAQEERLNAIEKRLNAADSAADSAADTSSAADSAAATVKTYPALTAAQKRRANGLKGAATRRLKSANITGEITIVGTWLWLRTDKKIHAADLPAGWRFSRRRAAWYRRIDD